MLERTCRGIQFISNEYHQVLEDMKDATRPSLSQECAQSQDCARRVLLRGAAASGNALRLKLMLRTFQWSEEEVTAALLAVASRRTAVVIARERPGVFRVSSPWAVRGALMTEDVAALRGLLDAGAAPDEPCGYLNETPLHLAAACCNFNCALELLLRGANPNACDKNGETPLHRAATHGSASVLWLLLHHGGASVDARCRRQETALHRVALGGHAHCAEELLAAGADVAARNNAGATPLHAAASAAPAGALVRLLLEWNADPEAQTDSGLRPMHYAATTGNYQSIRLLADCGADINARTRNGNTALHIASSRDSPKCVDELVRHGADLHAPDKRGLTPLHVAAAHGRAEVLRELLRLGARTDLRAQQITPLMIAVERRDEECGRALIEAGADASGGTLLGYLNLLSHRESPQNTQEDQNDNFLSST